MATLAPAQRSARSDVVGIMLVDDHAIVRQGLRSILEREDDLRVVAEASSASEALAVVGRADPQIVLLDLKLSTSSDSEGLAGAGRLGDDPQVVLALQDRAQALPDDRVVVDEHDAHDVAAGTALGRGERGHVRPPTGWCRGALRRGRRRAR